MVSGSTCLSSQYSGGWGRRTARPGASLCSSVRLCLEKKKVGEGWEVGWRQCSGGRNRIKRATVWCSALTMYEDHLEKFLKSVISLASHTHVDSGLWVQGGVECLCCYMSVVWQRLQQAGLSQPTKADNGKKGRLHSDSERECEGFWGESYVKF